MRKTMQYTASAVGKSSNRNSKREAAAETSYDIENEKPKLFSWLGRLDDKLIALNKQKLSQQK